MISNLIGKYFYFIILAIMCVVIYFIYKKKTNIHANKPFYHGIMKKHRKHKKNKKRVTFKLDKKIKKQVDDLVFLDIATEDQKLGRIVIKLFSDIVPKTCKNFSTLCQNKNGLTYRGCPFHRIIKDFMIQGGNIGGSGGKSIYGEYFDDENFELQHDRPYLLSMANHGENTNGSQFFITTTECPHLDDKHVVFGVVIDGFEIVDELNEIDTDANDKPYDKVFIYNCGKI